MLSNRHSHAWLQSDFYRDQFRKMLRWLIYCNFIALVLIGIIIYLLLVEPVQPYYGNTTEGKILPMPLLKVG